MSTPIRVVIADDHPVYRNGLAATLRAATETTLAGVAENGAAALELAREEQPDVVLMDVRMPIVDGIAATAAIAAAYPQIAVLMLTMFDDDDLVLAALQAGARGYILKESTEHQIVQAVVAIAAGGALLGPGVARRVRELFSAPAAPTPFPELTQREREILELIAAGRTNGAIAQRLTLSEKTVRNYVSTILTKLRVPHRAEAIVRAREAGLGKHETRRGNEAS